MRRTVIVWKRNNWLAAYVPEDVAKHYDKAYYDADGFEVVTRVLVSPIGYNTNLVKKEDAPKSFADLLDPKWKGKMVKAHPGYSGTIMTATLPDRARPRLGVLRAARQAERAAGAILDRPPKKLALGERARDGRTATAST